MLPFLARKTKQAGLIVSTRQPDEKAPDEGKEMSDDAGLHASAQDLIDAVQAGDAKRVAEALRSSFLILESQPHEEAGEDFDSMNEKAAEGIK